MIKKLRGLRNKFLFWATTQYLIRFRGFGPSDFDRIFVNSGYTRSFKIIPDGYERTYTKIGENGPSIVRIKCTGEDANY